MKNKRVLDLINQMTLDEKLLLTHGQMGDPHRANQVGYIAGIKRLGIPEFFLADGESGVNISWETTVFPSKVCLASTFDRKSSFEYGNALGKEAKNTGIHMLLTPRVNIARDPVAKRGTSNGGNYQTYSEDPVLNGELGAQEAIGIQNNNQALANLKQMFGSSNGTAQGAGNCIIDEQTINELYLRPFEIVIKAGAASLMTNYNQVNGTWTYDYGYATTKCARGKWGFKGFVFNDWYCLYDPNAIIEGVTLEMPGSDYYGEGSDLSIYGKRLAEAIADDKQPVTLKDLDRAIYYYLDTLDRFGILDEKQRTPHALDEKTKIESISVCREIATKGAVLLKNEGGILPINFSEKKVVVIGEGGAKQVLPTFKESPCGFKDRKNSVYNILKDEANIDYAVGDPLDGVLIPSMFLRPEKNSKSKGLKRYINKFVYETLSNGDLEDFSKPDDTFVVDEEINYKGETALPLLNQERKRGFFKESPREYYMWHGYLCPNETGLHRIALQSKFPGLDKFEENNIQNEDLEISTSGNLYIRQSEKSTSMTRVGTGIRLSQNGKADTYSEVVSCNDGYNNAGGYIYLEAGKQYEIYFNHLNIYKEPLELRLAWVTPSMAQQEIKKATELAKDADIAIVFAWHQSVSETMSLAGYQNVLIENISKVNKNTVVVLNNGDPIEMPWISDVSAVLEMWFSGQEGAMATVDLLKGDVNPSGKLPVTFPKQLADIASRDPRYPERYADSGRISKKDATHSNVARFTEGLYNGYRWFDKEDREPLFPFGFGLSYTTFEYSNIRVHKVGEDYEVLVDITNTGAFGGDEIVQCYIEKPEKTEVPCVEKALVDFRRIKVGVGETKTVSLTINALYLKYFDVASEEYKYITGERNVLVGSSSRSIHLVNTIKI